MVVEPTHLKNISQIGNLPQIGARIKNIGNHHLDFQRGVYRARKDLLQQKPHFQVLFCCCFVLFCYVLSSFVS